MAEISHSVSIIVHTNPKAKPIAKIVASALVSDGDQIRGWVEVGELEAHRSEIRKIMKS